MNTRGFIDGETKKAQGRREAVQRRSTRRKIILAFKIEQSHQAELALVSVSKVVCIL
jgi:hypothetical protein